MIRATLDHYPERVAIGALGVRSAARFARYVRGGRAAPGRRHPAGREPLRRRRGAGGDRGLPGGGRLGRGRGVVAAVRPRPVAAGLALRCRRRGPGAGAGDGPGAARAARCGVRLQRRRAGAARRRPARRGPPRRRLAPRGGQPRRLPRAAALGGGPAGVRVHHRRALAADPRRVRRAERGRPARGHRLDPLAVPARAGAAPPAPRRSPHRPPRTLRSSGSAPRPAAWRSGARARPWCAHSTPPPPRSRCPPAIRCWSAARSTTACCPRTPPSGSPDLRVLMPSTRPAGAPGGRTPRPPASWGWW